MNTSLRAFLVNSLRAVATIKPVFIPISPPAVYDVATLYRPKKAGDGKQQQHQHQGGHHMQHLLQGVAGTSDLLKGCILAREDLGAANIGILRAREETREASSRRRRVRGPASAMHGGSWERGDGSGLEGVGVDAGRESGQGEELAAMAAALPLSREFADKMAELAAVVPGLSSSLVDLTAVRGGGPSFFVQYGSTVGFVCLLEACRVSSWVYIAWAGVFFYLYNSLCATRAS